MSISPKFKELQLKWYSILKEQGFNDIEDNEERFIDHKSAADFNNKIYLHPEIRQATIDYYSWASEKTQAVFKCERDCQAWALHAEGYTGTEIALKLGYKNRKWINKVIIKIRIYLKEQDLKEYLKNLKDGTRPIEEYF